MIDTRKDITYLKNQINSIIWDLKGDFYLGWVIYGLALPLTILLDKKYTLYGIIIGVFILLFFIIMGKKKINALNKVEEILTRTEDILSTDQNIDEILKISRDIYNSLSDKKLFERYSKRYYTMENSLEKAYNMKITRRVIWKDIVEVYIAILSDLSADLLRRVEEAKNQLKQGKESIKNMEEKNGVTTKNLLLQRARLDKQIEQFEELQRVLVKV